MGLIADIHKDLENGAFQLIVEYHARLRVEAVKLCGGEEGADDLVFRTFEQVLAKADSYTVDNNLFGWMRSIMLNIHLDDMKRPVARGTKAVPEEELERCAGADWSTDEEILRNSDSEALRKALRQMDPEFRELVLMRYYEDLSLKEIAGFLNKPVSTVGRRIQIALRLLAGKLEAEFGKAKKPLAVLGAILLSVGTLFGAYQAGLVDAIRAAVAGVEETESVEKVEEVQVVEDVEKLEAVEDERESEILSASDQKNKPSDSPSAQNEEVLSNDYQENTTQQANETQTQEKPPMKLAQTFAAAALMATMAQDVSAQVITADVNLPAGYTRAECIQGDGRTCDVGTDFIPNPQTDRFVFEVEFTEVSHNMFVFCARRAAKDASWSLNVQAGYKLRFDYSSQQIQDTTAYEPNVRYACEVASNVLSYASSEGSRTLTATADPSFTEAGSALHLFCAPGNSASIGDFKLYSFKIYRNNALIHDLVPALNGSGSPALVDVVGNLSVKMRGGFSVQLPGTGGNEARLMTAITNLFNQVNPVVAGERKYISLAYITDTHKCKRVEGDTDPTNPVTNYWYHGELVDPEPSIRLLGKVAEEAAFDGLVHAGDFSTAVPPVPFDEGDYLNEIRNVKTMVSTHLPDTPFFAVDGNHDRNYWNADRTSGHSMSDAEWSAALAEINTDVSSNPKIVRTAGTGNSYTLDFKRCLANGGKNVRLVMVSGYDTSGGSDPQARMSEGLVFGDSSLTPLNTVVGVTAHDYCDGFRAVARTYLIRNEGAGFFGAITGHRHEAASERIAETDADHVVVKNAFSSYGDTSLSAYRFAIFVFDTDKNLMREIRLAGKDANTPVLIDHSISVGMGFEGFDHELVAIQGNGGYIETDFVLNPQTDKIVTELELTGIPASQFAFAARANAADSNSYSLNLRSNGYRFDYKGQGTPTGTLESGVKYTFTAENNVLTWSGGEGTVAAKDENFTEAGGPLMLFWAAGNNTYGTFRLYSFQIYRSGALIHDLRPYYTEEAGATLIDKVKDGDPIKLTRQGGAFIPVEDPIIVDPKPPRKAKRLEWIRGDGINSYFETGFVPDPSRDKMEAVVTLTDLSRNQFIFGARKSSESVGAWALQLRGKTQIRYDYNTTGTAQSRALEAGVKYVFTAETNTLSWSHGDGIQSNEPVFTPASGPLIILFAPGASGTFSTCKLHSFRIWRDGKLIHEFLPTRLPSGLLNLMDYGLNPILVKRHGLFDAGPTIPPKQGLVLIVY